MFDHPAVDALLWVAAVVGAGGLIVGTVWALGRFVAHVEAIHDVVVRELMPNEGNSIKDAVDDIKFEVTEQGKRIAVLERYHTGS